MPRTLSEYKWQIAKSALLAAFLAGVILSASLYATIKLTQTTTSSTSFTQTYTSTAKVSTTEDSVTTSTRFLTSSSTSSEVPPIATLTVQSGPTILGYNAFNENLYVLNSNSSSVSVIDTLNNSVLEAISTGRDPASILYVPSINHDVFVANEGESTISVIDPNDSVIATIQVSAHPSAMAFNIYNHEIYVVTASEVQAINASLSVVAAFNYSTVGGIAYDRLNHEILFTNSPNDSVVALTATNQIASVIQVGESPQALVFDNSSGDIYVANLQSESLSAINSTNQVVATIPVGSGATSMIANLDNGELYAINSVTGSLTAIDAITNRALTNISLGSNAGPALAAYDENSGSIYVPLANNASVIVISSSNQITEVLAAGKAPSEVFYDSINFEFYVINSGSDSVTVYSS